MTIPEHRPVSHQVAMVLVVFLSAALMVGLIAATISVVLAAPVIGLAVIGTMAVIATWPREGAE